MVPRVRYAEELTPVSDELARGMHVNTSLFLFVIEPISIVCKKQQPISWAVLYENKSMLDDLLEKGADISYVNGPIPNKMLRAMMTHPLVIDNCYNYPDYKTPFENFYTKINALLQNSISCCRKQSKKEEDPLSMVAELPKSLQLRIFSYMDDCLDSRMLALALLVFKEEDHEHLIRQNSLAVLRRALTRMRIRKKGDVDIEKRVGELREKIILVRTEIHKKMLLKQKIRPAVAGDPEIYLPSVYNMSLVNERIRLYMGGRIAADSVLFTAPASAILTRREIAQLNSLALKPMVEYLVEYPAEEHVESDAEEEDFSGDEEE
jgi:hypothetical protein